MIAVTYDAHMGSDLMVVNRARVSYRKRTETMRPRDVRLVSFLAQEGHWAPFAHPQIGVHVRAPLFVARQCFKHKVGFVESEVSRRYVDEDWAPEFFTPDKWRAAPLQKRQGSGNVEVLSVGLGDGEIASPALLAEDLFRTARETYDALIRGKVAPELARMVLPQATLTEWFWTGSLAAFARFCNQRLAHDAQAETREVAAQCAEIVAPLFPVSWAALSGWRASDEVAA